MAKLSGDIFYSTKEVTGEQRLKMRNGVRGFDICECCGLDGNNCSEQDTWKSIAFIKRHNNMILCSECIDKKDGTWNMSIYVNDDNKLEVNYPMKNETLTLE